MMKLTFLEFLKELDSICEVVYVDENNNQLDEAAIRAFKRVGSNIKRYYRCTTGEKAGRLVATPQSCMKRKEPSRVRHGRKVMRKKKAIISQKSRIKKRSSLTKLITRKNILLSKHK